jgi:hypothetical protein
VAPVLRFVARRHGVLGEHIDRLLGHALASVRERHDAGLDLPGLAAAVARIRLDVDPEKGHDPGPGGSENGSSRAPQARVAEDS